MIDPSTYTLPEGFIETQREKKFADWVEKMRRDHPDEVFQAAQRGPQTRFALTCGKVDILLYGGAAGSGKSWNGLADMTRHATKYSGYRGVGFRRTEPDLKLAGGLIDTSRKIYTHLGGEMNGQTNNWTFDTKRGCPVSGAEIKLMGLQHEQHTDAKVQGAGWHSAMMDEATTFGIDQTWAVWGRLRGIIGIKPYLVLTCNPDVDSWLRKWVDYYVDEEGYPIQARSGHVRWFIRNPEDDTLHWEDSADACTIWFRTNWPSVPLKEIPKPISFCYIPATLDDNPAMMEFDPAYRDKLNAMTKVKRERYLKGNWNQRVEAGEYYQASWTKKITMAEVDTKWDFMWGFDPAATEKGGDWSCATLLARDKAGMFYVVDHEYIQVGPAERRKWVKKILGKYPFAPNGSFPKNPGDSGKQDAFDMVNAMAGFNLTTSPETGSKADRMNGFTAQAAAGNVKVVRESGLLDIDGNPVVNKWVDRWESILGQFPEGTIDDDVDSTSRAFHALAELETCNVLDLG